jgi:hypothetical protein
MKRLFIVLLAAGLIAAFSMPVLAVDVKFSGEYYAAGYLERNRALTDPAKATQGFYAQRLRVNTTFKVADGLSLVTRFDALEKVWGQGRAPADTDDRTTTAGTKLQENVEFSRAYVDAKIGPGNLRVGYHGTGTTGTAFTDTEASAGVIRYYYFNGPWSGYVGTEKQQEKEWSSNYSLTGTNADTDADQWKLQIIYKWTGGDAGLGYTFYNDKTGQTTAGVPTTDNYYKRHRLVPFFRGSFGALYLEAEVNYWTGDYIAYNPAGYTDVSLGGWSWYGKARYTMGPVYFGGQYAYVQGDDGSTKDKYEGGYKSGRDYKPCLIFLNGDYDQFAGSLGTNLTYNSYSSQGADNFTLYQVFAGFKPIQKLEFFASYSIMSLNQKTTTGSTIDADGRLSSKTYVDDKIGSEFDITATYKIYDNLTYMIGWGYLWAGDAWKGTSTSNLISNDWLLMHRLTLNF